MILSYFSLSIHWNQAYFFIFLLCNKRKKMPNSHSHINWKKNKTSYFLNYFQPQMSLFYIFLNHQNFPWEKDNTHTYKCSSSLGIGFYSFINKVFSSKENPSLGQKSKRIFYLGWAKTDISLLCIHVSFIQLGKS